MIHLEKVEITGHGETGTDVLKKGFQFECESVNLLVGDQGCGKSTLLRMLSKNSKNLKLSLAEHVVKQGVESFYFDSEKDNPRVRDPQLYTTPSGRDSGIGFKDALISRFSSHGEVMVPMVLGPMKTAENCVILLDEPESGLSITNQFRLVTEIDKAVKRGCQFFIATHCYPLIQANNVVSLEHWKKMSGEEFIKKVKKGD